MFDFAWSEMAVIAVVALVVIGPKDLPRVLRTAGQWAAKARSMAREFQNSLEDLAREAELDDLKKEVDKVTNIDLGQEVNNTIDPGGDLQKSLEDLNKVGEAPASAEATAIPAEGATADAPAAIADFTAAAEPAETLSPVASAPAVVEQVTSPPQSVPAAVEVAEAETETTVPLPQPKTGTGS